MARRGFLVLAVIAALLGAPRLASAAANALASPSATPTTGTTETVFVLQVDYDGQFPATGVTAVVGTRALAMSLGRGSASSGTWRVGTTLPAGTWPVAYSATVVQGNAPSLSGPTLTVHSASPPTTPVPTSVSNPRTEAGGDAPTSGGGGSTPAPAPAQAPVTSAPAGSPNAMPPPAATEDRDPSPAGEAAPEKPIGPPAPSATPAPAGGDAVQPEAAASEAPDTPSEAAGAGGTTEPPRDGVMAGTHAPRPADGLAGPASSDDELLGSVLLLAVSGATAMALVGGVVLVVRRRRRAAAPDAMVASESAMVSPRARRLARAARLDDDPILASLGVGRTRPTRPTDPRGTTSKDGS